MLAEPITPIPKEWKRLYRMLRVFLYLFVIAAGIFFILRLLFPTLVFPFDFRNPNSSRNTFFDPHSPELAPRTNGKVPTGSALIGSATAVGTFSQATASITLEKQSAVPEELHFSLRRSYRSFLLPPGDPVTGFSEEAVYVVNDTYYALRGDTLHPFVSETAFLTRYPASYAKSESSDFLTRYRVSDTWLGFRVGTLVSFADGVFVIISETDMRPIGSADIFLALGYHFEDVVAGSEEDLGIYKRGRILLLGAPHPDGTLLLDQDSGEHFLVDQGKKRLITDTAYRNFLLEKQSPIVASQSASEKRVACRFEPRFSFSGRTLACSVPLDTLPTGYGNDFEAMFSEPNEDIDINTLSLSFETTLNQKNLLTLLSQLKQRFFTRFGAE